MPDSPLADGVLRLSITSNGRALPGTVQVQSCTVRRALNAVPWARITLLDGDMPAGDFTVGDGALFAPGAVVKISAGYGDAETAIFEGLALRHGVSIGAEGSRLVVECRDKAGAMALRRHNANFTDQKDSDIIGTLISAHSGLTADVAATDASHPMLVQHYCSDWDFMLARADCNGLVVAVVDGTVSVKAPDASASAALSVTWGTDLISFKADMDARTQAASSGAVAWDVKNQAALQGSAAQPAALNAQGNLSGSDLAKVVGQESLLLRTHTAQDQGVLDALAKAAQTKAALARIRGSMSFQGSSLVALGGLIEVKGVGKRFSGSVYVGAFQHELKDGRWTTEVEFGLDPSWHLNRADVVAPQGGGILPGVNGLQIGVVLKLDGDPAGENRVQVQIPVAQASAPGLWARLLQFYASNGFGAFFLPEVGDEVVLGYLDDDPSQPLILGSLYSSARKPPYAIAAANDTKAVVTRGLHKLQFDDKDKIITITTPGNNTVILDDKAKAVTLQDQNNNSVKLSDSGIALTSAKDIKLTAQGGITLSATNAINITSQADVKAAGLNISCEAQVGFTGKGSATAELSASGQTTVKGAMVMIN